MSGFAEISDTLWRERELLDVLLFKLETERLLLADGDARWLARSTHEIELVLAELRLVDVTRAMELDALADELRLGDNLTLAGLAEAAPAPWADLFRAHRSAFQRLTADVDRLAAANRRALDIACDGFGDACVGAGLDQDDVESLSQLGEH